MNTPATLRTAALNDLRWALKRAPAGTAAVQAARKALSAALGRENCAPLRKVDARYAERLRLTRRLAEIDTAFGEFPTAPPPPKPHRRPVSFEVIAMIGLDVLGCESARTIQDAEVRASVLAARYADRADQVVIRASSGEVIRRFLD